MPPGQGALDWEAIVQELTGIGYDGYLTVEFVVPVDRTPLSQRTEIADASESGASQGMEQFLRDHGTGALPEHYYDEYVQDSIDRLRKARRRRRHAGGLSAVGPKLGIALVGTLDTKGAEIAYVRDRLRKLGTQPVVIDSGILGEPGCRADVTREEVARAGGHDLDGVRRVGSRGAAVELMLEGVRATCLRLYADGSIRGVLCLGGAEGALLGAAAMHALPVGVPKLIVSPSASGRRAFGPVRRRERRDRDALGDRHPRAQPDRPRDLRQRRRGDRGDGARRRPAGQRPRRDQRRDHDARPDDARA